MILSKRWLSAMMEAVTPLMSRSESLLDVMCGYGDFFKQVKKRWPHVDVGGCDNAPVLWQSDPQIDDIQPYFNLIYEDDQFDVVTCFCFLESLAEPDRTEEVLAELFRVAKRNLVIGVTEGSHKVQILGKEQEILSNSRSLPEWTELLWKVGEGNISVIQPTQLEHGEGIITLWLG